MAIHDLGDVTDRLQNAPDYPALSRNAHKVSPLLKPLAFDPDEIQQIRAFLHAL